MLVSGIKPLTLSLDNYFVNREKTPLDENGEYDFETIKALDVEQFNKDLNNLLAGKEVEIPKFSFEPG
jgi:uridine kinase